MKLRNKLIGRDKTMVSRVCPAPERVHTATLVKQEEANESDPAGAYWSGEPGKDLFFNSWKLLF